MGIETLIGANYSSWKDSLMLTLGIAKFGYALREPTPPALTDNSTAEAKLLHEKWEKANRMALIFIKNSISPIIRVAIPDLPNAKAYLTSVEEQFRGTFKAHASTLIMKLVSTKHDGVSGIREHIMMMNDMARKLKGLDMEISDDFLVHFIMTSLPTSYEAFKINYNTQKEKWMTNELIAMFVQEEKHQKLEKLNVAYLMAAGSKKRKNNSHNDASKVPKSNAGASSSSNNSNGKPYWKFWRKGFLTIWRLGGNQRILKLGDQKELSVASVGTLKLIMKSGLCIILYDTLYIPEIFRNLVSGPKLDMDGFYVSHGNGRLAISSNSQVFDTGLLDGGHIPRDRLSRLVKDEVLPHVDFTDFGTCVKCLKGKMKTTKKDVTRSSNLLEIIHTDISGPYTISRITRHTSFITFIDDYFRYMYLYLIKDKPKSLVIFKYYKTEVENQLNLKIKVVRSDRGGEYYGRHTDVCQARGPFYEFCKGQGIVNQYIMSGTPQQNGVAERRNRTLMNMVRSIVPSKSVHKTPHELGIGRKLSLRYMKVWGCLVEDKLYNAFLKKLDMKTVTCYFIGYLDHSKGYRFYHPSHVTRIVEKNMLISLRILSDQSSEWKKAMTDELDSMKKNDKEEIDYQETFSPVSQKDSLRIVMALATHFDLELHHMDVKTAILNEELYEDVFMKQHEGFIPEGQEHLVCKLNKSICGLKQAPRSDEKTRFPNESSR
ncbi:hypothetical protein E3N88_04659 [Mikania micrantha]|uniref:Integrase catalytic domain-containing protein n=1 Tax=Mikania micrantha TaxID=192012 RepID=A0A5N6PX44_9ASTR|nr:hypothetical protein E3N88_04659 [Mikania micrantha]